MKKRIGVLGTGEVGITLAKGFQKHGHQVTMGTKTQGKKVDFDGEVTTYEKAAQQSDALVLAVKGEVAEDVVKTIAPYAVGKTVMDAVNPIASAPPEKGILKFFTTLDDSLMERLQRLAPQANFVKVFNSVGSDLMVNPQLKGGPPSMFICGNSAEAKKEVREILTTFGWETEDMGGVEAARAIEPLCILWCIPGFAKNDWVHAFKVLR
ncbi:MAG TPA: NAD(P)-binding domain-containing protein [Candidatus Angelobacter sp.]|jgi:predicted dinucleotide-binding enzyme|nr:NAD(P)-binding domain-containing protein [Candidatus Angelobacter sp.]